MITTIELQQVIRSLKKSEKRYFTDRTLKLNPDGTKYLELFELLDKVELKDDKFDLSLTTLNLKKNFSYTQNYLYSTLMDELVNFRKQNDIEHKIKNELAHFKILHERNLLPLASKVLKNAEKLAIRYEYLDLQLSVLELRKNLIKHNKSKSSLSKDFEKLNAKREKLKTKIDLLDKLKFQLNKVYELSRNGFELRNPAQRMELNQILNRVEQLEIDSKMGFKILFYYYVILETIHTKLGKSSEKFGLLIIDLFKLYKQFKEIDLVGYSKSLLNYVQSAIEENKAFKAKVFVAELRDLERKATSKGQFFLASLINEGLLVTQYYINNDNNDRDATVESIEKLNKYLEINDISLFKKMWYMHSIPIYFFKNDKTHKALEWCNALLQIPVSQGVNYSFYAKLKILEIILHFELGNYLLLPNLVETNEKYLKKHMVYFETENVLFKLFRNKVFFENSLKTKRVKIFKQAHDSLKMLYLINSYEAEELKTINYLDWFDKQLS